MTTITAVKWYEPKQPGWSGSFKAQDGNYYGCKEDLKDQVPLGVPVEVEISTKEKDGKTYRDIKRVVGAQNVSAPVKVAPARNGYGSTDDATAERIYCCGIINALVPKVYEKFGSITEDQVIAVTKMARGAWAKTFAHKVEADV